MSLLILVGPSGSGKTTIAESLVEKHGFKKVITTTTRQPRPNEKQDVDYHFVEESEFKHRITENKFVEYAEYAGNYYGTQYEDIQNALVGDVVIIMEINGAIKIQEKFPVAKICFINRPKECLIETIMARDIPEEEKKKRINNLDREMNFNTLLKSQIIVNNVYSIDYAIDSLLSKI